MKKNKLQKFLIWLLISGISFNCSFLSITKVQAAAGTLTALSDTMSRNQKNVAASHVIKFTTSLAINQAGDTIVVTLPSDFDLTGFVKTDVTFTHGASTGAESAETLADAPSATAWGAVPSGTESRILTLTAPTDGVGDGAAVAAGDKIILTYASTHAVNAGTAGSYTISIAVAGTNTATGQIGVVILDSDQIGVSATVDPTLTFAIANPTLLFGSFVGTAIRYANTTTGAASEPATNSTTKLTAATNGVSGWSITIQDQGSGSAAGLYSATLSELIPTDTSANVAIGSKKYGAYGKAADAGVTIHENFDNDGSDVALARTAAVFATTAAPSADKNIDLVLKGAIDATTKAGSYTDTITVICTGNY